MSYAWKYFIYNTRKSKYVIPKMQYKYMYIIIKICPTEKLKTWTKVVYEETNKSRVLFL